MKKFEIKFILLIALCISTIMLFCQDTIHHIDYVRSVGNNSINKDDIKSEELILINLGGGLSLPTGNFRNGTIPLRGASNNPNYYVGGLAKPGYMANVSATVRLSNNFGFGLGYLYQSNKCDEKLAEKITKRQTQALNVTVSGTNWLMQGGFAGLSYYIKSNIFKNLTLCLNVSSGYVQCTSPDITTKIIYPGTFGPGLPNSTTRSVGSSKTWAVAFLCGAGFSYKLSDYTGIHLSVNYLQTTPEFKDVTTSSSMPGQPLPLSYFEQKITSLNVQAGLIFYVNHYVKK